MADETEAKAEATGPSAEPPPAPAAEGQTKPSGRKPIAFILLCVAVAAGAAGAGYGASALLGDFGGTDEPPAADAVDDAPKTPAPPANEPQQQYKYKDLEPITVNLDEPRLARYVRASLTLAIRAEDFAEAVPLIDEKNPVLKDWLTVYLASCSLDDVRGATNLNRIRREILDAFNQQLWPDQKPRIGYILFKEFAVK